jgi:hypothetical protein
LVESTVESRVTALVTADVLTEALAEINVDCAVFTLTAADTAVAKDVTAELLDPVAAESTQLCNSEAAALDVRP